MFISTYSKQIQNNKTIIESEHYLDQEPIINNAFSHNSDQTNMTHIPDIDPQCSKEALDNVIEQDSPKLVIDEHVISIEGA